MSLRTLSLMFQKGILFTSSEVDAMSQRTWLGYGLSVIVGMLLVVSPSLRCFLFKISNYMNPP